MTKNPYNKYVETNLMTASPGKLVLILYDGALRFIKEAKQFLEAQDYENAFHKIIRAENIIVELVSSLNPEAGDIATSFFELYKFINKRLVEANSEKSIQKLNEAEEILSDIRDIWIEVLKKAEENNATESSVTAPAENTVVNSSTYNNIGNTYKNTYKAMNLSK